MDGRIISSKFRTPSILVRFEDVSMFPYCRTARWGSFFFVGRMESTDLKDINL